MGQITCPRSHHLALFNQGNYCLPPNSYRIRSFLDVLWRQQTKKPDEKGEEACQGRLLLLLQEIWGIILCSFTCAKLFKLLSYSPHCLNSMSQTLSEGLTLVAMTQFCSNKWWIYLHIASWTMHHTCESLQLYFFTLKKEGSNHRLAH